MERGEIGRCEVKILGDEKFCKRAAEMGLAGLGVARPLARASVGTNRMLQSASKINFLFQT